MVKDTFEKTFTRKKVTASFIKGDSFHKYNRVDMRRKIEESTAHGIDFTHFNEDANELETLEAVFREYGETSEAKLFSANITMKWYHVASLFWK